MRSNTFLIVHSCFHFNLPLWGLRNVVARTACFFRTFTDYTESKIIKKTFTWNTSGLLFIITTDGECNGCNSYFNSNRMQNDRLNWIQQPIAQSISMNEIPRNLQLLCNVINYYPIWHCYRSPIYIYIYIFTHWINSVDWITTRVCILNYLNRWMEWLRAQTEPIN